LVRTLRPSGQDRLDSVAPHAPASHNPRPKGNPVHILKSFRRYVSAFFKLGRIHRIAKQAHQTSQENTARLATLGHQMQQAIDEQREWSQGRLAEQREWNQGRLAEQSLYSTELSRRLDQLFLDRTSLAVGESGPVPAENQTTTADGFQIFLDNFYNRLENRFRGNREDILNRLRVYQPDVEAAIIRTGGKPVLDLGCGRGEWLQLMREMEMDIDAVGVDLNTAQISEAKDAGLDVKEMKAQSALAEAGDNSLSVVSAHHLIEHIPFPDVAWIAREALRVLAPGGLLIFETPNPRNVLVGATSFHNDPTHIRPLTDPVLSVLFETIGYHPVETRFLHPHERLNEFLARPRFDPELVHLLFGPQDLAMIGQKPDTASPGRHT